MKVGEKRFMSINLFFLHSYAYEISGKIYLLSYGMAVVCLSFFTFKQHANERVKYIESLNKVSLY